MTFEKGLYLCSVEIKKIMCKDNPIPYEGLTRKHLEEAVEHVFRNQPEKKNERKIKFKIFFETPEQAQAWYKNVLVPIFKEELDKQIKEIDRRIA